MISKKKKKKIALGVRLVASADIYEYFFYEINLF